MRAWQKPHGSGRGGAGDGCPALFLNGEYGSGGSAERALTRVAPCTRARPRITACGSISSPGCTSNALLCCYSMDKVRMVRFYQFAIVLVTAELARCPCEVKLNDLR